MRGKNKKNMFLTHKEMTSFYSLNQGVEFVLTNIIRMKGGEILFKMNSYN